MHSKSPSQPPLFTPQSLRRLWSSSLRLGIAGFLILGAALFAPAGFARAQPSPGPTSAFSPNDLVEAVSTITAGTLPVRKEVKKSERQK